MNVNLHLPSYINRATKIANESKWLKSVPCQTEHVSIYGSIWRSLGQCRCRYKANNNVWPFEKSSLFLWWWNHEIFLEHIGILITWKSVWKIVLESTLIFNSCRSWPHKSLSMTNFQAMIFGQKRCSTFLVVLPTFHGNDALTPWSPAFWYHDIVIDMGIL